LASDNVDRAAREQQSILRALANTPEQFEATSKFFYETTKKLIARHSYTLIGGKTNSIDIVRDVLKAVPVQWVATQVVSTYIFLGSFYVLANMVLLGWYPAQRNSHR
jgi:hypothetical protein